MLLPLLSSQVGQENLYLKNGHREASENDTAFQQMLSELDYEHSIGRVSASEYKEHRELLLREFGLTRSP
jgi:hypothetical protein